MVFSQRLYIWKSGAICFLSAFICARQKKISKQLRLLGRGSLGLVLLVQGLSKHISASPIDTNGAVQAKINTPLLSDDTVLQL